MKKSIVASFLSLVCVGVAVGQDPGWPRQIKKQGNTLIYYQNPWTLVDVIDWSEKKKK